MSAPMSAPIMSGLRVGVDTIFELNCGSSSVKFAIF